MMLRATGNLFSGTSRRARIAKGNVMRRGTAAAAAAVCSRDLFKEELKMKNGSHHSFFCTNQKRHTAIQSGPFSACLHQREMSLHGPFCHSLSPRAASHPRRRRTNEREYKVYTHGAACITYIQQQADTSAAKGGARNN
jgi:hypothetical protein